MKKYTYTYPIIFILIMSLFLTSVVHSNFVPKDVLVTISNINQNGGATVTEDINFLLTTEQDKQKYELTLDKNDIASWISVTNLDTIKYYVDPSSFNMTDLRVTPHPLKTYSSTYGGEITIEYTISPILNRTTGKPMEDPLFIVSKYKPRTYRYSLNPSILNFKRSSNGDVILDEDTTLKIILPERSVVYEATPSPAGMDFKAPMSLKSVSWKNQVLVKFTFIFDVEKSMSYEITEDVGNVINKTMSIFESSKGILVTIMLITIGLGVLFIKINADKIENKKRRK